MGTVKRVTKVICRFVASEFDGEGNLLSESAVTAGEGPFTAPIYFPFDQNLLPLVAQINEDLNATEGT